MLFDVIVPTYNNIENLKSCIAALEAQTLRDFRVLICVDGSTDGTFEHLESLSSSLHVVVLAHQGRDHVGLAATRNLALPHLSSPYVLLLDADMCLDQGALAHHADLLAHGRTASVGAIEYMRAEENVWSHYISARRLSRWRDRTPVPFNQFTAANSAIHSDDFVGLGGFDESVAGYGGEEFDFAYRLQTKRGLPMIFNQAAVARSEETKSLNQAIAQMTSMGRNLRLLREKHPEMPYLFLTDRIDSRRLRDRGMRLFMNPLVDAAAGGLMRFAPYAVQRQLINYMVIRAVWQGYAEAPQVV